MHNYWDVNQSIFLNIKKLYYYRKKVILEDIVENVTFDEFNTMSINEKFFLIGIFTLPEGKIYQCFYGIENTKTH